MNPHNYYTLFTRKSKSQKLVILSETQCSEVSKSRESKLWANLNYNDSPKVSNSLPIHNSPKWILRLLQRLSMTALLFLTISSLSLSNLMAVELNTLCTAGQWQTCTIDTPQSEITNNSPFTTNQITIRAQIDTFINYSDITSQSVQTFMLESGNALGKITHFINHGNISGGIRIYGSSNMTISNYGSMRGVWTQYQPLTLTLNNLGIIKTNEGGYITGTKAAHFAIENRDLKIAIQNYLIGIRETASEFNNFQGYNDKTNNSNSHLIIVYNSHTPTAQNIYFKDKNSKIVLDFGNEFELGKEYQINKLVVSPNDGSPITALNVDFSRLTTRSELYTLTQSGNNFIVNVADSKTAGYSLVGTLHKSNIKTMNNLYLQSNNMIYPHKYKKKKFSANGANLPSNNYRKVRGMSNLFRNAESYAYNSTNPLESNELFFYDNEWLLARDNVNARKVNMDYTHSVRAVNNSNVSKDAYYNKGAYKNKIITNDTRTNEINQYQSTNRVGNVSRTPNQNNRHLANQSNNSPCGSYKCIYIYKPKQQTQQIQPQPKLESKPKVEPKVVEQPKIQPQPKPIQAIRPTMPPPPKVEPKIEPKPMVQPKEQPKLLPKVEPKAEPKVVKVESKPTPPKPKVIIQDPYYFILTPYVAHNFFYESGRYNVSGLEYGFITAFSGKITEDNILGLHFAFSYGSLKDSIDSIFNITSMNIMGGLNYKFDIRDDMYLKARVDIFYFLNQVQSTMTSGSVIKPNNLGFGASVAYGKEWDFDKNGILGLEVALDYKGLMSPNILTQNGGDSTINESFNKALYNMLYVDLGLNYDKYFESNIGKWGLDTGLGVKVNATANALAKSTIRLNNIRDIDMVLDNDMVLAYLNVGGSYLLERKDFDMEFSLAYYGNFGDRTMSNAGGFEWRVYW